MKPTVKLSAAIFALLISGTTLLPVVATADTVGNLKYRYQYRIVGKSIAVSFADYSTDGCGYSGGDLYFFSEAGGSGGKIGSLSLYSYNWCGDVYKERYGYSEIDLSSLSISKDIQNASSQGTGAVTWQEYNGGQYSNSYTENIAVNIIATGIGDVTTSRSSSHTSYPGPWGKASSTYRSSGMYRNAEATGSISGDMGTNIIINTDNSSSQLADSKSATLTVE